MTEQALSLDKDWTEIQAKSIAIIKREQCAVHRCKRKPAEGYRLCDPCLRECAGESRGWMQTYAVNKGPIRE